MESAKRQDVYSTKRQGARGMVADPHEQAEPRFYTREFKLEAVRLSETSEKTVAQVARDLGVPERVLYRWRHELREQAERAFPDKGHQSELEDREPPPAPRAGVAQAGERDPKKSARHLLARPAITDPSTRV